ncbi:MAG: glycosyltransferase [Eubacterium sp.]
MTKILFFIPGLSEGGAEKVLRNLVNNMHQTKFDITVQTIDEYDPKKYLADGIHYKAINRCKSGIGKKIFNLWLRFCTEFGLTYPLYVKDDYDIEVAYLECGATKVLASSTNKKALKLAWVHCDLSKKEGMDASAEKIKKQYRHYEKVICVSEDTKDGFHRLCGTDFDTAVLHNVIDEDEIFAKAEKSINLNAGKASKIMVAVGRLTEQKNFARLIETCSRLHHDGYDFKLFILGEGPERENLEKQIKDEHLENVVELLGFIDNPYPCIKASDYVVCSSRYEGLSTVIAEGLILGKTVITTPCTGMKELLGDSEYGLIAEDSEDGLYKELKKVFDNPKLSRHYAEAAQERGRMFAKKRIVEETEDFFHLHSAKK